MYDYDQNGRVEKAITPTGGVIQLKSDISIYGAMVNITRNNKKGLSLLIQKSFVHKSMDHEVEIIQIESDRSFTSQSKWGHKFAIQTAPYILLQGEAPGLAESFPVLSIERTEIGKDIVNQVEWDYYANGPSGLTGTVGKTLKVNGESVLTVQLDRRTGGAGDQPRRQADGGQHQQDQILKPGQQPGWGDISDNHGADQRNRIANQLVHGIPGGNLLV